MRQTNRRFRATEAKIRKRQGQYAPRITLGGHRYDLSRLISGHGLKRRWGLKAEPVRAPPVIVHFH